MCELPPGDCIYAAARRQGTIYGLGMNYSLEAKYMSRGRQRIETFTRGQDALSRHDCEFDRADETFHAEYGTRWPTALLEGRSGLPGDLQGIRRRCAELPAAETARATPQELREISDVAGALLEKAAARASGRR